MRASTRRDILSNKDQHHPSVVALAERHAASIQLRAADAVTTFAGSMKFVYVHALLFGAWIVVNLASGKGPLAFDAYPFQLLTLIVSLEAIFLSTFVMIGQNRQAIFQQQKADRDFKEQETELDENTRLTREIHRLTQELHAHQFGAQPAAPLSKSQPTSAA